jgi:hypothetical protein
MDRLKILFQTLAEQRAILDAAEILGVCAARLNHDQSQAVEHLIRAKRYLIGRSNELSLAFERELPEKVASRSDSDA